MRVYLNGFCGRLAYDQERSWLSICYCGLIDTTNLFFSHVWVHFGLSTSIVSDRDNRFLCKFWTCSWKNMNTRLKRSTIFHPQIDGKTEVVNRKVVQILRGYYGKHPKS